MNIFLILLSSFILIFIFALILGQEKKALENPTVGDLVFIRGPFDPDNGWIKGTHESPGMEKAPGQRGVVIETDKSGCVVNLENGQTWHFAPEDIIIL